MGYLDPGLFGLISQLGVSLLFIAATAFMFFFKPIKKVFNKAFNKEQSEEPENTDSVEQ
jgi:hypothetical protein